MIISNIYMIFCTLHTVFKNHRKSRIQHCERSELRFHFEWPKVHKKCQKIQMRHFWWFSNTVLYKVQKYLVVLLLLSTYRISTSSSSLSKLRPNLKERDDNSRRVVYSVTQKTLYFATKEKVNLSSNIWLYFSQIFASQK